MTQVSEALGRKIREIRKNRRCTLEELGQAVHKSKATLSKYETGDIVIDVETSTRLRARCASRSSA